MRPEEVCIPLRKRRLPNRNSRDHHLPFRVAERIFEKGLRLAEHSATNNHPVFQSGAWQIKH